jgi:predicted dehydrogenase
MNTAKRLGFAVVGLGSIAQTAILPAFAKSTWARLAAVVSRDKNKAQCLASKFNAGAFYGCDEFTQCLANPEVSAVYIATPPSEHLPFAVQAANCGKHVLCEKPLAATVAQSLRMVESCRSNGVVLMTAYRKYFEPSTRRLKELIQSGDLGKIDVIHTTFSELYSPGISAAWLVDPAVAGGGSLMDLGVYCVNTSRWLVDEDPVEASAESWNHDRSRFQKVEEGISFRLRFPSGLVVQGASTYSAAPSSFLYIQGTKGWVSLTPAFPYEEERLLIGKVAGRMVEEKFGILDEFALELDAFAAAIQNGDAVEADGVQGHRDVIILHAIYESAKTHEPVVIRYS